MSLPPLHYSPLQIVQPREKKKRKVPRQSWPAAKSALTIRIPKGQAAGKLPPSLSEVNGAIQSLSKPPNQSHDIMAIGSVPNVDNNTAQQVLTPGPISGSSSSNTKPERYALTPSPSPDIYSLRDPSEFRTPAKAIIHNLSEPPQLTMGKRRSRSEGGEMSSTEGDEMSPTERHRLRLGKRRMRVFFWLAKEGASLFWCLFVFAGDHSVWKRVLFALGPRINVVSNIGRVCDSCLLY